MTSGDVILMSLLRSKLDTVLLWRKVPGHSRPAILTAAGCGYPHCCGLRLKAQTRLLLVPLGMANTPGNTWFDCARDLI